MSAGEISLNTDGMLEHAGKVQGLTDKISALPQETFELAGSQGDFKDFSKELREELKEISRLSGELFASYSNIMKAARGQYIESDDALANQMSGSS